MYPVLSVANPRGAGRQPAPGIRWLGLGVLAFAVQMAIIHGIGTDAGRWLPVLVPASHLLLLPFIIRNLSFWGIRIITLGLVLNLTVMIANGGLMPIQRDAVETVGRDNPAALEAGEAIPGSKDQLLDEEDIRLGELSDRIVLPFPRPFTRAISVGDLVAAAGALIAYADVLRRGLGSGEGRTGKAGAEAPTIT